MEVKIDLEKLICSIYKATCPQIYINGKDVAIVPYSAITEALKEQGIEYKDGSLQYIDEEIKLEEGKWYVYTHDSLYYDTIYGEVEFKKDKPYKAIGEITLWGDGGDFCFRGLEDVLKNFRPATEEEIRKVEKPNTIRFEEEPNFDDMVLKAEMKYQLSPDALGLYRKGLEDMWRKLKEG